MANIVQQVKALNAFLNGAILFGNIEEINVPDLELNTEDVQPGTDGMVQVETGLALMDVELAVRGIHADVAAAFGSGGEPTTRLEVRAALENVQGDTVSATWVFTGLAKMYSVDPLQGRSELAQSRLTINCYFYEHVIDGVTIHSIDVMNDVRMINGVDRLASIRDAIGI